MSPEVFEAIIERRIGLIRSVLAAKGREYAPGADRLNNFRRQSEMERKPMADIARTLMGKQITSIQDMIDSRADYPQAVWDEKIGDVVNYCILIEAIVWESKVHGDGENWPPLSSVITAASLG